MSLYDITIPQMIRVLGQVPGWLDKATAYAEKKKFDPDVLLSARLAPDQWSLAQQILAITIGPQRLGAFVRGVEPPKVDAADTTIAGVRARLDAAISILRSFKPEEFKGMEDRMIPLPFMPGKGMKAMDFVIQFAMPNFYFHVVTTYAILRHNGVDVGKLDFIGSID